MKGGKAFQDSVEQLDRISISFVVWEFDGLPGAPVRSAFEINQLGQRSKIDLERIVHRATSLVERRRFSSSQDLRPSGW